MLYPTLRHTAELSLIYAVPILSQAHEKSRLSGLQRTLQRIAAKELGKLPHLTDEDCKSIIKHITEWGNQTGWLNNKKAIGTLLSFIAELIEKSQFKYNPKILETVNELISHLESGNDFRIQSCWAGSLAAERWEAMFNDAIKEIDHGI